MHNIKSMIIKSEQQQKLKFQFRVKIKVNNFENIKYSKFSKQKKDNHSLQMKTKKDQGNALFKKQKFKQAIECYKAYVSVDNEDNQKAYSNMALSYFKMKQYQNCVWACERAVQLQPQFEKPYFRMFESYREMKDYYGMIISGSKFCRLSKQEKEIKGLVKELAKVKQELCYNYCVSSQKKLTSQQEKFIDEIVASYGNKQTDGVVTVKEPLMSRQSRWERIVVKIKEDRRVGLNEGRRFINCECQGEEQKSKYKKLLAYLKSLPVVQNAEEESNQLVNANNVSSESSLQQPKVEELQQYALQKEKQQQQQQKQQQLQQQQQQQQQSILSQPSLSPASNDNNANNPSPQLLVQQTQQKEQSSDNQANWRQFVTQQQSQRLFNQHINTHIISKQQDPFTALYTAIMQTLRSLQLDRFQKQAILSLTPAKVKKFSMLMKSYSGKQKQALHQLFIQNNLGKLWLQLYISKK